MSKSHEEKTIEAIQPLLVDDAWIEQRGTLLIEGEPYVNITVPVSSIKALRSIFCLDP